MSNKNELITRAKGGDQISQVALGRIYLRSEKRCQEDFRQGLYWFEKAAEQDSDSGQLWLGWCYERGLGVKTDLARAFESYMKSAQQGNSDAQFRIALAYSHSKGVARDDVQSASWLKKSANNGFAKAEWELGMRYVIGLGLSRNISLGYRWLSLALEHQQLSWKHVFFHGVIGMLIPKERS